MYESSYIPMYVIGISSYNELVIAGTEVLIGNIFLKNQFANQ